MINTAVNPSQYEFGVFRLDVANRSLLRDGTPVQITQKSFEILRLLVENQGRILTKQEILDEVWTEAFVEEATLTQHIYMVRKALRQDGDDTEFIETVPKYGYRFRESVREVDAIETSSSPDLMEPARASVSTTFGISDFNSTTYRQKDRRRSRSKAGLAALGVAAAAALIAFAAYLSFPFEQPDDSLSGIDSIAVLPFDQIGEPKDEKLGIGMADSLIGRLSKSESLPVSPTSEVAGYSRKGEGSIDIGKRLGVEAVLTGTIQRDGERVRISVQLVRVDRNVPVWTHSFDSDFHDAFALQDTASEIIADRLSRGLGHKHGAIVAESDHFWPDAALTSESETGKRPAAVSSGP